VHPAANERKGYGDQGQEDDGDHRQLGVGTEAGKVCHALYERDVCVDYRGDGIRVSPHFFSTHADVDRLFDALREIL